MSKGETINLLKINTDLPKKCGILWIKSGFKKLQCFLNIYKKRWKLYNLWWCWNWKKNCHKNLIYINNVISIK